MVRLNHIPCCIRSVELRKKPQVSFSLRALHSKPRIISQTQLMYRTGKNLCLKNLPVCYYRYNSKTQTCIAGDHPLPSSLCVLEGIRVAPT